MLFRYSFLPGFGDGPQRFHILYVPMNSCDGSHVELELFLRGLTWSAIGKLGLCLKCFPHQKEENQGTNARDPLTHRHLPNNG